MNKTEVQNALQAAQNALTEIVNYSNVGIKKIATIIKVKRDLQKIIDLDYAIINAQLIPFDFPIENNEN